MYIVIAINLNKGPDTNNHDGRQFKKTFSYMVDVLYLFIFFITGKYKNSYISKKKLQINLIEFKQDAYVYH